MTSYCACGRRLHYADPSKHELAERIIAQAGDEDVAVQVGGDIWAVQRHYIALHGLKAAEIANSKFPKLLGEHRYYASYRHDTGGHIVDGYGQDYRDQIFSHQDPDDDRLRHFHIPKLLAIIERKPEDIELAEFPVNAEQAQFVKDRHNIDLTHMDRIKEPYLDEPGIICLFGEQQLIVDGNHRYIKRSLLGLPTMQFWMVPEKQWCKSLLNLPSRFKAQ